MEPSEAFAFADKIEAAAHCTTMLDRLLLQTDLSDQTTLILDKLEEIAAAAEEQHKQNEAKRRQLESDFPLPPIDNDEVDKLWKQFGDEFRLILRQNAQFLLEGAEDEAATIF